MNNMYAGASFVNITPKKSLFLYGYPFVERMSTGVHDWLLSSALYLVSGSDQVIFISNDVIFISKASAARVRRLISEKTGVPEKNIMVAATHTHSGPATVDCIIDAKSPSETWVDQEYIRYMEDRIIEAGCSAFQNTHPAELGLSVADGTGIGTNRHDPAGPSDMEIPVLSVRNAETKEFIAVMLVCNMHPTVLHEDSKLYSGDYPSYTREILQKDYLKIECPVLYFTGTAGNQSPRHVTEDNTFNEACRLGGIVAKAASDVIFEKTGFLNDIDISCIQSFTDLPRKKFPAVEKAQIHVENSKSRLDSIKKTPEKQAGISYGGS